MNSNLDQLKKEFYSLSVYKQKAILWEYVMYVQDYPDDHDEGCYPACFFEWYDNDYVAEDVAEDEGMCPICGEELAGDGKNGLECMGCDYTCRE
jgi:hypothetical protein